MGVDCHIYLPPNVCVDNVARVLGVLAGLPTRVKTFGDRPGDWTADIPGVRVQSTAVPTMMRIVLWGPLVDGTDGHSVYYHLETCGTEGLRMLHPRSTAFWIAAGIRLVEFFGGHVDFNDCDDAERDFERPHKTWRENSPQDGAEWTDFQNRVMALTPLTEGELRDADQHAAYKTNELKRG